MLATYERHFYSYNTVCKKYITILFVSTDKMWYFEIIFNEIIFNGVPIEYG